MLQNYITEENRIYLPDENWNILAEVTFEKINDEIYNIDHTFVASSLRWQGIANKLVENAVDYIHSKWYEASATCSYAKKWLNKNKK